MLVRLCDCCGNSIKDGEYQNCMMPIWQYYDIKKNGKELVKKVHREVKLMEVQLCPCCCGKVAQVLEDTLEIVL